MAEVLFRAKLTREEASNPWGFRLQGGVEFDKPLTLLKVVPESLAAKGGLHPGDIVVKLAGKSADDMTHKDAQEAIMSAGNALEIIVERAEVTITTNSPSSPSDGKVIDCTEHPMVTGPVDPQSKDDEAHPETLSKKDEMPREIEPDKDDEQPETQSKNDSPQPETQSNKDEVLPDNQTKKDETQSEVPKPKVEEDSKKDSVPATSSNLGDTCAQDVTKVNSLPDDQSDICNTNNNVKEMLTLEKRGENSLLENSTLAPGGSAGPPPDPSEDTSSEDKTRVKQDNNVRKDKGIDSATNAKHKPPPDKKDMTQASSLENDRKVAIKATPEICDKAKDKKPENKKSSSRQPSKTSSDTKVSCEMNDDTENIHALSNSMLDSGCTTSSVPAAPAHATSTGTKADVSNKGVESGMQVITSENGEHSLTKDKSKVAVSPSTRSDDHSQDSTNLNSPSSLVNNVLEDESKPGDVSQISSGICDNIEQVKSKSATALVDTNVLEDTVKVNKQPKVKCSKNTLSEPSNQRNEKKNDIPTTQDTTHLVADGDIVQVIPQDTTSETTETPKLELPTVQNDTDTSPSVIKEFQSNDESVLSSAASPVCPASTQTPETHTDMDKPDSSTSMDMLISPKAATDQELSSETTPKPNIPQSSPASTSDINKTPTIAMVVTEVPKPTIRPLAMEVTTPLTATNISPSLASTVSKLTKGSPKTTTIVTQSDKAPGVVTYTPVTIRNQKGVALAQTVLKSPSEPASKQTQAPTEEIIIAPKPSVQIMATQESKDSAKVKVGEKLSEEPPPNDSSELQDSKAVSHEMKDFSKTAPWRVHKQSGTSQHSALHPWRKSRTEHIMSHSLDDRQLSAAAGRMTDVYNATTGSSMPSDSNTAIQSMPDTVLRTKSELDVTKPQSSLTYVGKRIESPPVGSPIGVGAPFFKAAPVSTASPAGRDVLPSDRSNSIPMPHTTMPSTSDPNSMLKPSPTSELISPKPEEIQAAAPDLVDIPMPAVKEMVENLNKRLEAIAEQHPKIVEPATSQELGLNYYKRSQEDLTRSSLEQMLQDYGEREIIINTPPNPHFTGPMLEDIKQQLFGPRAAYQDVYQLLDPTISPGTHRRRFSLPGGSVVHRHNQRRVRFAEPLESSVIEIEPRKQHLLERLERRRFFDDEGSMSDMEDYSSASSLAATLDRIERENALSTASFQRHRNAKHRVQHLSGDNAQTKPAETFREKVISFESLGEPKPDNVILTPSPKEVALGQGRSGSRGFSLSIGQNKPGSISLSLTQRGAGQPPTQVALAIPPTEGHFSYTISPRTGSIQQHGMQPSYVTSEPVHTTTHMKSSSLDSAKTIHIQYPPQEGVPTIQTQLLNTSSAGPLSPPHQVLRQLAGRPGIRSPTNYSNTLQIDTSSRLQHRSPSPPHLALSPNMQSERTRLSPQRLVPPLSRLHDTTSLDQHQAKRSSSPIQGTPLGPQPGLKIRHPSPTNPMAYQRSVSPQGHPQLGPVRQGTSPVPYQQVGVHPSTVNLQPSSPRNTSPVSFQQQHQPVVLQSAMGYQRSVSPQGNISLVVPQSTPYQPGPVGLVSTPPHRGPRMMQQQSFQPPGYPFQGSQMQQNPRLSPRFPTQSPGRFPMTGMPRSIGQMTGGRQPKDMVIRSPEGYDMSGHPMLSAAVGQHPTVGSPGQLPTSEPLPPGVFALFDKKFAEKFVQWHDERPEGLYESETYKLVHEMDEETDDI